MTLRTLLALCMALPWLGSAHAQHHCKIGVLAEIPVTMLGMQPTIPAKINGTDVRFLVDSGAFYSVLSPATAARLGLRLEPRFGFYIEGVGGSAQAVTTTVKDLTLFDAHVPKVQFVVGGTDFGAADVVGILGQNFLLGIADVEYDLSHGAIRLMVPHDCKKAALAYWVKSQPFSEMEINWATTRLARTMGVAYLNGEKIRVLFDTGAGRSAVSLRAAERVGVKPGDDGVQYSGQTVGVGRGAVKTWIATFRSFRIADEEIKNAKLSIIDSDLTDADMLIGPDFFLSHRIYVAGSQDKLYFTYNGGPVFNLAQAAAATRPDIESPATGQQNDAPTDAASLSRRGSAFLARNDLEHAIADLTSATELDASEPSYWHQLGVAHWRNKEAEVALQDFDRALALKKDDVPTLMSRAELYAAMRERSKAIADLDATASAVAKEDNIRQEIGHAYLRLDDYGPAITQFDLWAAVHRDDAQVGPVLNARCWARALEGQDLKQALTDCNRALTLRPGTPEFLDSRALVQFKLGKTDKALADWDAAVKAQPKNPWFLYARGVTKLRKSQTASGQEDIAAATALSPKIAELGQKLAVVPP